MHNVSLFLLLEAHSCVKSSMYLAHLISISWNYGGLVVQQAWLEGGIQVLSPCLTVAFLQYD